MSAQSNLRVWQRSRVRAERGVATLIVVMVLFFIVSLVAAYTSRNLIFEQRTSANQYRSTQAFEAAQAGLGWALAMLNRGLIDPTCTPSAVLTDTSFRQHHLSINTTTGAITPVPLPGGGDLTAACVLNAAGTDWDCNCPVNAAPALVPPTAAGTFPAFQVRFVSDPLSPLPPGVVRLESIGCIRFDAACLSFAPNPAGAEGRARVSTLIALQSALKTPPGAALTVHGGITLSGAVITAHNSDVASGGIAVQLGGAIDLATQANMQLTSTPGTPIGPGYTYIPADPSLSTLAPAGTLLPTVDDRMFALFYGLTPPVYRGQPAVVVPCNNCDAVAVRTALALNPGRPLWIPGNLTIDTAGDIGSPANPALLIVQGNVTFTVSPDVTVYGVVYSGATNWSSSGSGIIQGAAIAQGSLVGTGTYTYAYDAAILNTLRLGYGSFVAVPTSWRDTTP